MELLVVRHAIAGERDPSASAAEDARRALTPDGRRKFERGARGLRRIVPSIGLLATSTLVRAVETGEILQAAYGLERAARLPELAPDARPSDLLPWLGRQRRRDVVAVVGHEPHLSRLVEYLLSTGGDEFVELRKGGACLVALGDAPARGRGELRWLLTASQLRKLGG
jgi:phosphohistidine phosphatase